MRDSKSMVCFSSCEIRIMGGSINEMRVEMSRNMTPTTFVVTWVLRPFFAAHLSVRYGLLSR